MTQVPFPVIPLAPYQYSRDHQHQLQRVLSQVITSITTAGPARHSTLVLTDLPTDDVALEENSVYKHGNRLLISVLDLASVRGAQATSSAGSVDVVIS